MKLEDFTVQEQEQIKKGLTFSVISSRRINEENSIFCEKTC